MGHYIKRIVQGFDPVRLGALLTIGDNREQGVAVFILENDLGHTSVEHVKLNSLEREDGSGNRWNMTGYTRANNCQVRIFWDWKDQIGRMWFIRN